MAKVKCKHHLYQLLYGGDQFSPLIAICYKCDDVKLVKTDEVETKKSKRNLERWVKNLPEED